MWERGSLPSEIQRTGLVKHVVDGIHNAPISGESWDNVAYLRGVDRMAVIGVSREGDSFLDLDGGATGPYFWDPSRADVSTSCAARPGFSLAPSVANNKARPGSWSSSIRE